MNGTLTGNETFTQAAIEYRAERDKAERHGEPQHPPSIDTEIERLAKMPGVTYDMVREIHADELGIRVSTLDKAVTKERKKIGLDDKSLPPFANIKPWPDAVDGADLLAEFTRELTSHVILPAGAATAIALWTLHAHTHDSAYISPIIGITSPTPECGKTTLLTFLGAVVPRPLPASNITSAALFRVVEKWTPTLLVDEADTFLRDSDELRGVLNSGHNRANACVIRTVGDDHEPCMFRTWAPKAIACIGKLPSTLASRAIHIPLRRKGIGESVVELRQDRLGHLAILAGKAARWAADNIEALKASEPEMPATLSGRRVDNWRHMLAIADLAGGVWPSRARKAAEAMVADDDNQVAGILLLQDIKSYFKTHKADRVTSLDLVETLKDMIERPWPEWKSGRPITERQVAKLLGEFQVKPRTIRDGMKNAKGYLSEQFKDAFGRYLPSKSPVSPSRSVTPSQVSDFNGLDDVRSVTSREDVTDRNARNPLKNNDCDGVTDRKGETSSEGHVNGISRFPEDRRPNVCQYCRKPNLAGSPLLEISISGVTAFAHEACAIASAEQADAAARERRRQRQTALEGGSG